MLSQLKKKIKHIILGSGNQVDSDYQVDFDRLHTKYILGNFPRYTEQQMKFGSYSFIVPDAPSVVMQLKETFFEKNFQFNSEKKDPLIYDCGTNVGVATMYFKKLFPQARIKAFEADKKILAYYEKNIAQNKLINGIDITPKAVWINDGHINFGSEGSDGGSIFQSQNVNSVECVRLKKYIEQESVVDFLKMDIEGAESEIIVDCDEALQKVRNIFIEFHSYKSQRQNLDKILHVLTKNNFRYTLANFHVGPEHYYKSKSVDGDIDMLVNIYAFNEKLK